jgi:ribosomal-protein-alanine N-acetyltransferase
MELRDAPQVSQIEREAFPPPWPPTNFKRELTVNTLTQYLVAYEEMPQPTEQAAKVEAANDSSPPKSKLEALKLGLKRLFAGRERTTSPSQFILGFAGLWFMVDEAHLANIAVREDYRHQGIGERLLISAIELSIEHAARHFTLEVRASNKIAQAMYRKYGLIEVGKRRGYYIDNKEDAVIMTVEGITSTPYDNNFQRLKEAHAKRWGLKE